MIPEGACDTENWSNDAENSTLYHRNKPHIQIENSYYQFNHLF